MDKYQTAKKMYIEGRSIKNIAKELNMCTKTLSNKLQLDGVEIRGVSVTTKDYSSIANEIIKLYDEGNSIRTISKLIKVPRDKISLILKQNDVNVKKGKYEYDENIFDVINTEAKAYWLGFLYADGYVYDTEASIVLKLAEMDLDHLKKYRDFLNIDAKIHKETAIGKHGHTLSACKIFITNKKIHSDLITKGCTNKKSLTLTFPSEQIVPKELQHHFVRGYLDGDGCIFIDRNSIGVNFVGTEQFLLSIQDIYDLGNLALIDTGNAKYFSVKGNRKAINFLDKLYTNATIYMQRKYDIYLNHKTSLCRPR